MPARRMGGMAQSTSRSYYVHGASTPPPHPPQPHPPHPPPPSIYRTPTHRQQQACNVRRSQQVCLACACVCLSSLPGPKSTPSRVGLQIILARVVPRGRDTRDKTNTHTHTHTHTHKHTNTHYKSFLRVLCHAVATAASFAENHTLRMCLPTSSCVVGSAL